MHGDSSSSTGTRQLHINGLYVETSGNGHPAVVLVHAGIADHNMWDAQVEWLRSEHHVISYDVRGFGRSADPAADYYDHEDLLAVLDAAEVARAVVVGASNGGRIAVDLAVTSPQRVSGLLLAGPSLPGLPTGPGLLQAFEAEDAALERGDLDTAREVNLSLWVTGVGREPGQVAPAVHGAVQGWLDALLPRQATAWAGDPQLVEPPIRDRVHTLDVPVAIVVGEHDQPKIHMVGGFLHAAIAGSVLEIAGGAAHLVNLERPELFRESLTRLVASATNAG